MTSPSLAAGRSGGAIVRFILIVVAVLAVDLISKNLAFEYVANEPVVIDRDGDGRLLPLPPHGTRTAIPGVLGLHLTVNEGAVFGLGQGMRWIFIVFSVIATAVIGRIFAVSRPGQWIVHTALAAVLGGALGNMYDRVVYAGVRDMLYLFPGAELPFGWTWPGGARGLYPWIFNVADVALVVGLAVLLIAMFRADRAERAALAGETGGARG